MKPLRVPVTQGLKDIYAMDMLLPYQAACNGRFSVTAFGRLAAAISVVRTALVKKDTHIPDAVATLDTTIGILSGVRTRGDATDVWESPLTSGLPCWPVSRWQKRVLACLM